MKLLHSRIQILNENAKKGSLKPSKADCLDTYRPPCRIHNIQGAAAPDNFMVSCNPRPNDLWHARKSSREIILISGRKRPKRTQNKWVIRSRERAKVSYLLVSKRLGNTFRMFFQGFSQFVQAKSERKVRITKGKRHS